MLGALKKIFARPSATQPDSSPPDATPAASATASPSKASATSTGVPPRSGPAAPPDASSAVAEAAVLLPLKGMLQRLPAELKTAVARPPRGDACFQVGLATILDQLPKGAVKITFADLKRTAPPGVFAESAAQDQTVVELPLADILARLRPDQLPRRSGQKRVEVPDEIRPIFGAHGLLTPPPEVEAPRISPASAPAPAIPARQTPLAKPSPPTVAPSTPVLAPKPSPPVPATPPTPVAPAPKPAQPTLIKPSTPLPDLSRKVSPAQPVASPRSTVTPSPMAPVVPAVESVAGVLEVPLESLSAAWPESVRGEIANLSSATLALPLGELDRALKSGKISYSWKQLRAWLRPASGASTASPNDDTLLALPLPVVIPKFLAARKPAGPRKRAAVGENIPDLFKGIPGGAELKPPAAPNAGLVPTPAPLRPAAQAVSPTSGAAPPASAARSPTPTPGAPAVAAPRSPSAPAAVQRPLPVAAPAAAAVMEIGAALGQPGRGDWAPLEIVQRVVTLPGVAGVVIAMPDGLLVADRVPPGLSADSFAAFLPQLFGRLTQYLDELKLGSANRLTITVGNAPLQVTRAGGVYFAVLGRDSEPLPALQLDAVTAYLARQTQ
jgi:predicted regulator of Ras-like GTPase activity (Roadblock/LC7/MglB family)